MSQTLTKNFVYHDGGRAAAGYKGVTGDCTIRAMAIAAELPYQLVYDEIIRLAQDEVLSKTHPKRSHPRTGVRTWTMDRFLKPLGFKWVAVMKIGTGCRMHLRPDELPSGRLVVRVSKHVCAVIDGVIYDTYDPSRGGTRCVYGFWVKES